MERSHLISLCLAALILLLTPTVSAHSPLFVGDNESLEDAMVVNDPTKSWAIYNELHQGGEAQYYLLDMKQGERLVVSLIVPAKNVDAGFRPSLAIMGPELGANETTPSFVEIPSNVDVRVVSPDMSSHMEYEPFTPAAFHELAYVTIDIPVDGLYYIAVYDLEMGGKYGLAIGTRETFTAEEWLIIPFLAFRTYQWEGQTTMQILIPAVVAFAIAMAVAVWRTKRNAVPMDLLWALTTLSGALMIGTTGSILFQMYWGLSQSTVEPIALVSALFAAIPLVLGALAIRAGLRKREPHLITNRGRVGLVVIGALGLVFWAGWIIGPAMIIAAAVLPSSWLSRPVVHGE